MKIAYIAHPISGNILQNLGKIISIVRAVNLEHPDVVPLVPYFTDILALDDNIPAERQRGINNDIAILRSGVVNELWVYGNWQESKGCKAEIELARECGISVVFK
jgi:hypothetical protein